MASYGLQLLVDAVGIGCATPAGDAPMAKTYRVQFDNRAMLAANAEVKDGSDVAGQRLDLRRMKLFD